MQVISSARHTMYCGATDPIAARIQPGEEFVVEATSFTEGYSYEDIARLDPVKAIAPLTGPIWIEGARPGQTLKIEVREIHLTRDFGCVILVPGKGALGEHKGSHWASCGKYTLNGPEPDWQLLECGPNLEWCCHRTSYHNKTVCPRCDGKKYQDSGGHTTDPGHAFAFRDHKDCVSVEELQEPVKSLYLADPYSTKKNWHVSELRICEECGGTGKVQPKPESVAV